jgi:hypothetical protein
MIDVATNKPLRVVAGGTEWPYIEVSVNQLDALRKLLNSRGVRYWVDEHVVSLNGGPEIADVDLGRGIDPNAVQKILDSVP